MQVMHNPINELYISAWRSYIELDFYAECVEFEADVEGIVIFDITKEREWRHIQGPNVMLVQECVY